MLRKIGSRAAILTPSAILIWGIVGYMLGGWNEALVLGLVGGPCFALAGIFGPVLLAKRGKGNKKG